MSKNPSQTPAQALGSALTWEGKPIPCAVRVVVYQAGHAAAVGIQAQDSRSLTNMLGDGGFAGEFPDLLHQYITAEIGRQGIKIGLDEQAVTDAIADFVGMVKKGSGDLVTRQIAEGQLPVPGEDARLEYVFNPDGVPIATLASEDQRRAQLLVHQVRVGQTLVLRHPAANAKAGLTVRGDPVKPGRRMRDESLDNIAGDNTDVRGERLVATMDGVVREDKQGAIRVVQELVVDEVTRSTGDLPKAGIADASILIRKGVGTGTAVQTTEDVLIGTPEEGGSVDGGSSIRARHLVVRGLVAGGTVPEAVLDGELESLEEAEQQKIRADLARSQIKVEGIFAAREVVGRSIAAGSALVQDTVQGAALEVEDDLLVDGSLVGGLTVCGGMVKVLGNLGNPEGTTTRIRLGMESPTARKRRELTEELRVCRLNLERQLAVVEEHRTAMAARGGKSRYWASLMKGDKRPPAKPIERRLLVQFRDGNRKGKRLREIRREARQQVRGLERLLRELDREPDEPLGGVRIRVGCITHAGVRLEAIRLLTPEDGKRVVEDRKGGETTLAAVRAKLTDRLERYLALYEEGVKERREALDRMFEDADNRPPAPKLPDRRFGAAITVPGGAASAGGVGTNLVQEVRVFVRAHDPNAFYLRQTATLRESVRQAAIAVDEVDGCLVFTCTGGASRTRSWQRDADVLERLDRIQVTGISARAHLLE